MRSLSAHVTVALLLLLPAATAAKVFAVAEEPPPGITVSGGGLARVAEPGRLTTQSIDRAVEAARPTAVARALRDAGERAAAIAAAAGVQLGRLEAVEVDDAFGQFGSRAPSCRGPRGRGVRCRAPLFTGVSATATYAIGGATAEAEDAREVESYAIASAAVEPAKPRRNGSIRKALLRARRVAIPKAVAAARRSVELAAQSAGLTLGRLVSIAEQREGYPYPYPDQTLGSFGAGRFCGMVRRGRRGHRVWRKSCYFPRTLDVRVGATYEAR